MTLQPPTFAPHPLAPATQEQLTAATAEATRRLDGPTGIGVTDASAPMPVGAAQRPAGLTPSEATRTRYAALAGCPDLSNHAQLVEAIGYADRARRLSKRQRWTRVERMAINAAVAYTQADAQTSHARALAIWSEIQTVRGMQLLDDAQDAELARAGSAVAS